MQNAQGVTVHPIPSDVLDGITGGDHAETHTGRGEFADMGLDAGTYEGRVAIIETGRQPFDPVHPLRRELEDALLGYHAGHRCWEAVVAVERVAA